MKIFLLCVVILGNAYGAVLDGVEDSRTPHRWKEAVHEPTSYEVVTPIRVTRTGNFISHDLTHLQENDPNNWKSRKGPRQKRNTQYSDSKIHYSLTIDGQTHLIELEPNHKFLAPHAVVERRSRYEEGAHDDRTKIGTGDGTFSSRLLVIGSQPQCHFVGHVSNHSHSKVALSACGGLKGFLRTRTGEYLIEPLPDVNRSADQPHLHKIYRKPTKYIDPQVDVHAETQCGAAEYDEAIKGREVWEKQQGGKEMNKINEEKRGNQAKKRRSKRSVSVERNVEVLVVADKQMIDFYANEDLNTYILTIMNMVSSIYHDASIGNAVNIIVVRILLLETPQYEKELDISHDAEGTLESFCRWQQMVNPSSETHPHHHDVAVLLTRHNICSRANAHCSTLGLAEIAGMCQPNRSCNVNEDTGLQIAYTVAHEIGHNFGMSHDGVVNGCGSSFGVSEFVMSPHLATDTVPMTWSNCSRTEITKFLDRDWGTCLVDEPMEVEYRFPQLPPGAMYDADHQCRLAFGARAKHCDHMDIQCQTLWCRVDNRCVTRLEPAAEGTQCDKHKWCSLGECVTMVERPVAIHGNWGEWSEWSACSRSCGAGIQAATRHCANPAPANGGKYCIGDRRRYRICNTEDCPESSLSFRAVQCSEFDNKPYKRQNYTWAPVTQEQNPCQLHCKPNNEFYSVELRDSVVDGTPCKPGTRDMCIHGVCKSVACDWTIEGTAQEDRCGLCHGDGTQCITTGGTFNLTRGSSYLEVVTFPQGALKVRVEEDGDAANYFAIKDKESGEFYLNGNWIIQWSGEYSAKSVMIYYKRENETETLFLPGPLKKTLTLMLLFQTENPGLHWEYTIPHENATYTPEFDWHLSDWSVCTQTCGGGTQVSKPQCLEKEAGLVEDKYCKEEESPDERKRTCNAHACPAWWWSGPWQPCSVTCGPQGIRKRTVICVRSFGPTEQMALADSDCAMSRKPHEEEPCPEQPICQINTSWAVSPWIESCRGDPCEFERRDVRCTKVGGECDILSKPAERRQCSNITCGQWNVEQWGKCSVTCGYGVQIRAVKCVGGAACTLADEPAGVKECKMPDCSAVFANHSSPSDSSLEETFPESHELDSDIDDDENFINSSIPKVKLDHELMNGVNDITKSDTTSDYTNLEESSEIESVVEKPEDVQVLMVENHVSTESDSNTFSVSTIPKADFEYSVPVTPNSHDTFNTMKSKLSTELEYSTLAGRTSKKNETHTDSEYETTHASDDRSDKRETIGESLSKLNDTPKGIHEPVDTLMEDSSADSDSDSPITSAADASRDSGPEYEVPPDDYYEFDPHENEIRNQTSTTTPKAKETSKNKIEPSETLVTKNVKMDAEEASSNETNTKPLSDKTNERATKPYENLETNKVIEDTIQYSSECVADISKLCIKGESDTDTNNKLKDILEEISHNKISHYNFSSDYDYSENDDYYSTDDDYISSDNGNATNETIIERPNGIIEDTLDLDEIQVIELRMKNKKKSGKKYRHKNKKDNIKKVKIHTGLDAIRILNKFTKKANAKTATKTDHSSLVTNPDSFGVVYKWMIGEWSECSEPCGGGSQTRLVECLNASSGLIAPSWECHALPPPDLRHCNMLKCLNWTVSAFGPCSESCGSGIRTRTISCKEEGKCHPKSRPAAHEECKEASCIQWIEGPWSMCTKSCGAGYQIRYVKCVDVRSQEASQDCQEPKPPHKRLCNTNQCQTTSQGQQNQCKDSLDTKLCSRLVHMCSTKFFSVKCCKTCLRRRG